MPFNAAQHQALADVLPAITAFKRTFGRDLSPDFLAELYVAQKLGLTLPERCTEEGGDAVDERTGRRYQVKHGNASTQHVDVNDFEFDFLVLVNMDDGYQATGMWLLPVERLKEICVERAKYLTWQISQARFKREAEQIL